jgi:NADH-quinone oxidoreductase subunit J
MSISPIFFYIFAGLALGFSALTVAHRNPVASAFSLVMVFFSFAGIYALLDAHLVAALQVLVYAGAIMVLFVFVIMLLGADVPTLDLARSNTPTKVAIGSVALATLIVFVVAFKESPIAAARGVHTAEAIAKAGGNTKALSALMFSEYILPFELTSLLLLAGIVGAVSIAKRNRTGDSTGNSGGQS